MASPRIPIPAIESVGKRYGRLVVQAVIRSNGRAMATCLCDCGVLKSCELSNLRLGKIVSCGCRRRELHAGMFTKHGEAAPSNRSAEYRAWTAMKARCANPKVNGYARYGGRGVSVCERWLHSFDNFLEDVGRKPTPEHSLDRKNNDGNYEPGNCRWATRIEQANNGRRSRFLTLNGVTMTVSRWATSAGLKPCVLLGRIRRGWSAERALVKAQGPSRRRKTI